MSTLASRRVDGRCSVMRGDDQGGEADGHVDREDPAPADAVGDDPADERADDTGHREHAGEVADVVAPLAGRDEVADDAEAQRVTGRRRRRPARSRPTIRASIEGARPHMSEPTRKTTMAVWNMRRRPKRSPTLPHSGVDAVEVSR